MGRRALIVIVVLLSGCGGAGKAPRVSIGPPKYQVPSDHLPVFVPTTTPNELLICFGAMRRDEWRCVTVQQLRGYVLTLRAAN
jgi:hypothetical protein